MTLELFRSSLVKNMTPLPVYHIMAAPDDSGTVLCWQELGASHAFGDDVPCATAVKVQLDLFTESEYDTTNEDVEDALRDMDVFYTYEGVSYDNDRAEWRHIWTAWFLGG